MQDNQRLTDLLHQELQKLPLWRAPETLIPGVLQRLKTPRPWWQESWFAWPWRAKIAVGMFALSLLILAVAGIANLFQVIEFGLIQAREGLSWVGTLARIPVSLVNAIPVAMWKLTQQLLLGGVILFFLSYCLTLGLGVLCYRTGVQRIRGL